MDIQTKEITPTGVKLFVQHEGKEVGRAYLYIMTNDLHERPFGFMEDVFVSEEFRGKGLGTELVNKMVELAKEKNCYKVVGCSRYGREKVHALYEKLGWTDHGKEFRIDF